MPVRSMSLRITSAARSSGRTMLNTPPYRPTGVRKASITTARRIRLSLREKRRGFVATVAGAFIQPPQQTADGPRSDFVDPRHRAFGVVRAEPHRGVDVLERGDACVEGERGLVEDRGENAG